MRTNKANKRQTKRNHRKNRSISCEKISSKGFEDKFFKGINMDIKDDFLDPMNDMPGFDDFGQNIFDGIKNDFGLLLDEKENTRKNSKKSNKRNLKEGTMISKVYCSSYNNINGKEHKENYQSQSINQINNGHNISECKEAYKNSEGVNKTAYQRGLDKKGERLIREKNTKTGENKEHKIFKGMKENDINTFDKEYNEYSKKIGFEDNRKLLNSLGTNKRNNIKQLTDGSQKLNKKTKRH